jgi:hypothetical protein
MWYIIQGGAKHYPLTIRRVKEIKQQNARGIKVDDLQPVELAGAKEAELSFVDVVGHLTISNLEKTTQRNREKQKQERRNNPNQQQQNQQRNKPPQQNQRPPQNQQRPNRPPQNNNRNKPPEKGK